MMSFSHKALIFDPTNMASLNAVSEKSLYLVEKFITGTLQYLDRFFGPSPRLLCCRPRPPLDDIS
jgi:hypothetical protein